MLQGCRILTGIPNKHLRTEIGCLQMRENVFCILDTEQCEQQDEERNRPLTIQLVQRKCKPNRHHKATQNEGNPHLSTPISTSHHRQRGVQREAHKPHVTIRQTELLQQTI